MFTTVCICLCDGTGDQIMFSSVILMKCNRSEDTTTPNGSLYFEEVSIKLHCIEYRYEKHSMNELYDIDNQRLLH